MKIYTKTGDKGQTSLFGGKRVSKSGLRVETYGTVDELNAVIGLSIALLRKSQPASIRQELTNIQHDLFTVGSWLANPKTKYHMKDTEYLRSRVETFEKTIDGMTLQLPPLKNFIFSGGGETGAMLQFARTVARRAERRIVALAKKEKMPDQILIYFNRLSDLFFTMARLVNKKEGRKETLWVKK